jgi:hypothetical protein
MQCTWSLYSKVLVTMFLVAPFCRVGFGQTCGVSTIIRVVDKREQPIVNLTVHQLRAEIGGSPAKISSFSPAGEPAIVLVIDISSSMKDVWSPTIAATRRFVERAGDDTQVVLFRDKIRGFGNGRSESEKLLNLLSSDTLQPGGTALYDTLIEVANEFKARNTAIVAITDGEDNASLHSSDATASLLTGASSPPVFALVPDYAHEHTRSREYFKKIPATTGGLIEYPPSASKVQEAMDALAANVLNSYGISLQAREPITKPTKLKLEVLDSDGKPRKDAHALHVAEVSSCDSGQN